MRVYINPQTLQVLKIADEDMRFMRIIFRLHGELFMGDRGSYIVELAASWPSYSSLPVLISVAPTDEHTRWHPLPAPASRKRIFWRDLHALPVSGSLHSLSFSSLPVFPG